MATGNKAPRYGVDVSRSKNVPWFQSELGSSLTPAGRALLEIYSGIPASEVEAHIYKNRDSAWEVFPWPCIGEFWFATLGLSLHPRYDALVARLRAQDPPTKLLDLGTCLGQDVRKLVLDGAPVQAVWHSDYFAEFKAAGHELFRDADTFRNRFIAADLLDESQDSKLVETEGTWDVVSIVMFLHVFDWDMQVRACKRILRLLSKKKGSMTMGVQTGSTEAGEMVLKPPIVPEETKVYRQSMETFVRMWEEVGRDAGVDLKVEVEYDDEDDRERRAKKEQEEGKEAFFSGSTQRRLFFTVTLV